MLKAIYEKLMPEEVREHYGNENHWNDIVWDMRAKWQCKIGDVLQWCHHNDIHISTKDNVVRKRPSKKYSQPIEPTEEFEEIINHLYSLIEEQWK